MNSINQYTRQGIMRKKKLDKESCANNVFHLGGDIWEETSRRRHLGGDIWEETAEERHLGIGIWEDSGKTWDELGAIGMGSSGIIYLGACRIIWDYLGACGSMWDHLA
jgi:hypothetical protein